MRSSRITTIAAIALLVGTLVAATRAEARNGRIAAGVVGGFAAGALFGAAIGGHWGPGPYYYGYPAPVYYYPPAPYYAPYGYYGYHGCYRRSVWTGRHWRRVLVCG
jgi:hypothetical protein